ncbi:EAL domain-containing protein [Sulfurimonas sp.]
MNKFIKYKSIIITIAVGIFSLFLVAFFYNKQKEFTLLQKEFMYSLNKTISYQAQLEYKLLKNYIYAYNNNDDISQTINNLQESFQKYINSQVLKQDKYKFLIPQLQHTKRLIQKNIHNIEIFMRLDASIKNSLIYLINLDDHLQHTKNIKLAAKASKIVESFLYVKRLDDLSFLNKSYTLNTDLAKTKEEKIFLLRFNMHTKFLAKLYPKFLKISNKIRDNQILKSLNSLSKQFSKVAKSDLKQLNQFAFILFMIFILNFAYMIVLLLRLIQKQKSLQYSLTHDILTTLPNRYALEHQLLTLSSATVMIINIDRFKDINDTYGNSIGDIILKELAIDLKLYFKHNFIYRLGGDEFCVIFENIIKEKAFSLANALEKAISQKEFYVEGIKISLSISISINSTKPLLENCDLSLKKIKETKQQKVIFYEDNMELKKDIEKNIKTIELIKRAIKDDLIQPYFQPIINLSTLKIEKYEALVRIVDGHKAISPYFFLQTAQKTNYYEDIVKIMIIKTLNIAKKFPDFRFSLNMSMQDIVNSRITKILFEEFDKHKKTASNIDIELLESEGLNDIKGVKAFIDKVHNYGSLILMDDFGSGYSNFEYFAQLDIDIVKIDGSIVNEIATDERKLHMLKSIREFSIGMNLKNVAEFVDSQEIVDILKEVGVEYAQGYFYSPPIPYPITDYRRG